MPTEIMKTALLILSLLQTERWPLITYTTDMKYPERQRGGNSTHKFLLNHYLIGSHFINEKPC